MTKLQAYRFPIFMFASLVLLALFCFRDITSLHLVELDHATTLYSKSSEGRWGAFSYDFEIRDHKNNKHYIRGYRNFSLFGFVFDFDDVKQSEKVTLLVPSSQLGKTEIKRFYVVSAHPRSRIITLLDMIAYMISNELYIFAIPLILSITLFKKEFGKDYKYINLLHAKLMNVAYIVFIMLIVSQALI